MPGIRWSASAESVGRRPPGDHHFPQMSRTHLPDKLTKTSPPKPVAVSRTCMIRPSSARCWRRRATCGFAAAGSATASPTPWTIQPEDRRKVEFQVESEKIFSLPARRFRQSTPAPRLKIGGSSGNPTMVGAPRGSRRMHATPVRHRPLVQPRREDETDNGFLTRDLTADRGQLRGRLARSGSTCAIGRRTRWH